MAVDILAAAPLVSPTSLGLALGMATKKYAAVREVALTRFDQGREAERFEVGIGKPNGEGFAPGEMPGATAAAGRVRSPPGSAVATLRCNSSNLI
jgi:hypothetical protein